MIADPEIAESEESPEGIQDVSLEETGKEIPMSRTPLIGLTEEEAQARVAEAVAAKQVELTEQYEPQIKDLRGSLLMPRPRLSVFVLKYVTQQKKNSKSNSSPVGKRTMGLLRN